MKKLSNGSAFYTDPWKSDEKVVTVVCIVEEDNVDDKEGEYWWVDGVEQMIDKAEKENCGLDCDLY